MLNSDYGQIVVILEEGINGINAHGLLDVFEPNTYTNTTSASLELTIDAICFSKSEIRGIISLLERMGISTTITTTTAAAAAAAATVKRETTTMSTDVDEEDEEEEEVNNNDGH
jgi:ribosomal protein L12E/L44/L45/RPP1/RPP2